MAKKMARRRYKQGRININEDPDGSRTLTHPSGVRVTESIIQRRKQLKMLIAQRDVLNQQIQTFTDELPQAPPPAPTETATP